MKAINPQNLKRKYLYKEKKHPNENLSLALPHRFSRQSLEREKLKKKIFITGKKTDK